MVPCLHVAALVFRKWSNKRESLSPPLPVDYLVSLLQGLYIRAETVSLSGLFWQGLQCHRGAEVSAGILAARQTNICQGAWKKTKHFLNCKWCVCPANSSVVCMDGWCKQESSRTLSFKSVLILFEARCHENTKCY